jgi:hypothetical protein
LSRFDQEKELRTLQLTLEQFLKDLVSLMRQDYPRHLQRMIADTAGLVWLQTLDNETVLICVTDSDIIVGGKASAKKIGVKISLSRKSLFDLLEGRLSLDKALQTSQLDVVGEPATLLKCYRVFEQILLLSRLSPRFYFLTFRLR